MPIGATKLVNVRHLLSDFKKIKNVIVSTFKMHDRKKSVILIDQVSRRCQRLLLDHAAPTMSACDTANTSI